MNDNRHGERIDMLGQLTGEVMVYEPMTITELSVDGLAVETRFPLQLESLHDMRLTLGTQSVVVKARVVHSRIRDVDQDIVTYRSGLEYVQLPAYARDAIAEFLEAVRSYRSGV